MIAEPPKHGPWMPWFAWFPVNTIWNGWIWLRRIERRRWRGWSNGPVAGWDYRKAQK